MLALEEYEQSLVFVNRVGRTVATEQRSEAPKRQERGRRRIESILDAAEEVIGEIGYDATTTNLIASRAGISPGSFYQYFPNKTAVVEALAHRYVDHLAETHGGLLGPELADLPLDELVDRVVDPIVSFNLAHPAVKSLLSGVDVSPELAAATAQLHDALCDRVEVLLGRFAPRRSAADRHLAATMSFQIFSAVLPSIVAARPRDRSKLVRELKTALIGYWTMLIA
jgi:AcrR family transcriptional regulator